MKSQNVQRLMAISLSSAALVAFAACGNNNPQSPAAPTQNTAQTTPSTPRAPMAAQPMPGQPFPGQPMPGSQPFPGQPMPPHPPFLGQPMPELPASNVSLDIKIIKNRVSRPIVEVTMTETDFGTLSDIMSRLNTRRRDSILISNSQKTVIFACKLLEVGGTQCVARLEKSPGMSVSTATGAFRSYGLNLLDFSGAEAITGRRENYVSLKVSDSSGASFALVMGQSRDNPSEPWISIQGQATSIQ